jgi:uncharacterized membrane protein YozB (DUF420 family)
MGRRVAAARHYGDSTVTVISIVIVAGCVVHGMLVEGTMETVSKAALCALLLAVTIKMVTIKIMAGLRVWRKRATSRGESIARQETEQA